MIKSSESYKKAIVADYRRTKPSAYVDIISPDIALTSVSADSAPFCDTSQVFDRNFIVTSNVATLEKNRWLLDGSVEAKDFGNKVRDTETGLVLDALSDENGNFQTPQVVEVIFSGITGHLQTCTVFFSDMIIDSVPKNFKIEIRQGGNTYFEKSYTDNFKTEIVVSGFDVINADAIRLTIYSTVIPNRRVRIPEIYPGVYAKWDSDGIQSIEMSYRGDFSDTSSPYGTCDVSFDNSERQFEFRNKSSLFKSIEERQSVSFFVEIETETGTDRKPAGVFYQFDGGWKISKNTIVIEWNLVDIIGLLADRQYIPESPMPKTLEEWTKSIVSQLGENFSESYIVDESYAEIELIASAEEVKDKTCGEILNDICLASDTWARADIETGRLAIEPLWSQGNEIALDNMETYPVIKANDDVATITFKLNDASESEYVVSGNSSSSSNSITIENPFIRNEQTALKAARTILKHYGGQLYEITYRGDVSSEIGDTQTIQLDESQAAPSRLKEHSLSYSEGVLSGCNAVLIQPSGQTLFESTYRIADKSGVWTAPTGVKEIYIILVGGGSGGTDGQSGTWDSDGDDGENGRGGRIFFGTFPINEQQNFTYYVGDGGDKGKPGEITTFGVYSSDNGTTFEPSFTDLGNGNVYGRTGVKNPVSNSGDGGAGGKGGEKGEFHLEGDFEVIDAWPSPGEPGEPGASGCIVIWWDKNA